LLDVAAIGRVDVAQQPSVRIHVAFAGSRRKIAPSAVRRTT